MSDIEIEIDGKLLKAKPNSMVIQVADEAGIYIPRFCYHKHLTVAANCRMCLVEVEKSPKALPACATPVAPGMKVFTRSAKATAAQKAVMEFLLINHPLDCPICDQGGECELQDLSMGYGSGDSYYREGKRSVKDQNIGPLVATCMTRCIQCTRCVRFGDEIAGLRELGGIGRGEDLEISTYVKHALHSEVSGNIIDLCPVGALLSKPYRFTARPWELEQHASISPHDCLGTNINVHTRRGVVMRVVPRENNTINETWISDRDRFSYLGLQHPERLGKPLIKVKDQWRETDWQTALNIAVKGLQTVIEKHSANELAGLASPNSTVEEFYLFQKLLRQLGTTHMDHRLRQVDFRDETPPFDSHENPRLLTDISEADRIILVGSNVQKEQPLLGLRIRTAATKGAKISAINMVDYQFHFQLAEKHIAAPHHFVSMLASLVKAFEPDHVDLEKISLTQEAKLFAEHIKSGQKIYILVGAQALNHPDAAKIRYLAKLLAKKSDGSVITLTEGGNTRGAWLAGVIPRQGDNAQQIWSNPRKAYLLLNVDPEFDCANPVTACAALASADFTVALSEFQTTALKEYADVILPVAPFAENFGTYVNLGGQWQSFHSKVTPFEESRPAWKVLRVLGNFFELEGFDFENVETVLDAVKRNPYQIDKIQPINFPFSDDKTEQAQLSRIGEIPIYAIDSMVRHASALQETQAILYGELAAVRLHPNTAAKLALVEGEVVTVKQRSTGAQLPVVFDNRIPEAAAYIAGGTAVSRHLDDLFGLVRIERLEL